MRAFSSIEILIALAICSLLGSSAVLVSSSLPMIVVNGAKEVEASMLAETILHEKLELGSANFQNISSEATSTFGVYQYLTLIASLSDNSTKKILTTLFWTDAHEHIKQLETSTYLTDLSHPVDSCESIARGNWKEPDVLSYVLSDGGILPGATNVSFSGITADSGLLAGVIASTTAKTAPSLYLFSLSSSAKPNYLSSIDNSSTTRSGIAAVVLSGNYVFAANAVPSSFATCSIGPACAQLQVFTISNPSLPILVQNVQLATTTPPFALGSEGQASGKSIALANNRLYLGLTKTGVSSGEEFNVLDISNPLYPKWLGGFSVGRSITSIHIRNSLAYLSTDDPTRELIILDVHDPAHITQAGTYDAPGKDIYGYGRDVALSGDTLALVRTYSPNGDELSFLSVSSTSPVLLSNSTFGSPAMPLSSVAVLIRNFLTFYLDSNSLSILDISDPAHPQNYLDPIPLPANSTGTDLTCYHNTVYISSSSAMSGYLTVLFGS